MADLDDRPPIAKDPPEGEGYQNDAEGSSSAGQQGHGGLPSAGDSPEGEGEDSVAEGSGGAGGQGQGGLPPGRGGGLAVVAGPSRGIRQLDIGFEWYGNNPNAVFVILVGIIFLTLAVQQHQVVVNLSKLQSWQDFKYPNNNLLHSSWVSSYSPFRLLMVMGKCTPVFFQTLSLFVSFATMIVRGSLVFLTFPFPYISPF